MNISALRHPAVMLWFFVVLMVGGAGSAQAHSTKGRIRIPLTATEIGVDDLAYFAKSYVHHQLYKDRFTESKRRFYVKEFIGVDQQGKQADIRFIVLDMKTNSNFPDSMSLYQGEDGVWRYRPENGPVPVEIHTYVMKWGYYYHRYLLPASAAGIVLAGLLLVYLRSRKNRQGTP